jgi:hypothetical protein
VFASTFMERCLARAALFATARVESAAGNTTNVHGSREPTGDERTAAQNRDQDSSVQKEISQSFIAGTPNVSQQREGIFEFKDCLNPGPAKQDLLNPYLGSRT